MSIFAEIAATNRAYCRARGIATPAYDRQLSDEELNGKPLSEPELEHALVIDVSLSRAVAASRKRRAAVHFEVLIKHYLERGYSREMAERFARNRMRESSCLPR